MTRRLIWLVVCVAACLPTAWASQPGERLSAADITFTVFGFQAATFVPVDPEFDYSSCGAFPTPADLRCDLLAQNGFDAEGRQYAIRLSNSPANPLLARTEFWRTGLDGATEMFAYLDPRPGLGGSFDDGRIDRIAIDPVSGVIYGLLSTVCFPSNAPACLYQGRANEVVRIGGLKTLRDVLVTGQDPQIGSGGGSKLPIGQSKLSRGVQEPTNGSTSVPGEHP